jgi:riboflavin kinase/FMN adenylyltransferase
MKFIDLRTRAEVAFIPHPIVLCIGDFDGVHIGHRQLVDAVLQKKNELEHSFEELCSGAWFFDSNLYKSQDEIYSVNEKLDVFSELGLQYAIIADFNEMKSLIPSDFVLDVLQNGCYCVHAVCGENFRFGSKASGDAAMLKNLMQDNATVVPLLKTEQTVVSSTYIRSLLSEGNIEKVNELLETRYSITETVVHGKALGRKLGIPTINQNVNYKKLILKNGIYATICTVDDKQYYGVTNVGVRPTVENTASQNVETYLINYDGDCYDKNVKVEFCNKLRDEMKFENVDALKAQILCDIEATKKYFNI